MKKGEKYGKLTVVREIKGRKNEFICECGVVKMINKYDVLKGKTSSCGCIRKEKQNAEKHGLSGHKLYMIHKSMKQRCYNPNNKDYKNYGNRGIKMCVAWESDFLSFYNWSLKNGWKDGKSIDRINNNKGYEPNNCRWVSMKTQANNHRRNSLIEYKGKKKTLQQWSDELGIDRNTITTRLNLGWSVRRAFTEKAILGKNQYKKVRRARL